MPFVCIKIPQFAAWALAQTDNTLVNRPFVVCEQGRVVAASSAALQAGIYAGMTNGRASARLSSVLIVSRDKSCESFAWQEVQRTLYGLTPKVEPIQPGLLFCDVAPTKIARLLRLWNGGIANKIESNNIESNVDGFGVSAGAAGDRATAQLAALQSPQGVCRCVKPGVEWSFAGKVPLKDLAGEVCAKTLETLEFYGWPTLSALRQLTRRQLEEQFDGKGFGGDGVGLFRFAQGARCRDNLRPVSTWQPKAEITTHIEFELPAREPAEWNQGLVDTLISACLQLGPRSAQTIEITAFTPVVPVASRRILREPASNPKSLILPLQSALEEALRALLPLPAVVQGFEIRLGGLTVPDVQTTLWEDPHATREKKLQGALERIEARLPGKMQSLTLTQPDSPFEEENYSWSTALERLGGKKRGDQSHALKHHATAKR